MAIKKTNWYQRRKSGIKVARRPKPPRWEKEGDTLYQEIVNSQYHQLYENQKITHSIAKDLLQKIPQESDSVAVKEKNHFVEDIGQRMETGDEAPYLWGGLSVGPVWKARLLKAGLSLPTPIQSEAFTAINQGQTNVILASTTGSGKSLAYLLPLLSRGKKNVGMVWIITPTIELALQLQSVIGTLVSSDGGADCGSLLHVVGQGVDQNLLNMSNERSSPEDDDFPLLSSIDQSPMILAGTPRILQQLKREIEVASSSQQLRMNDEKGIRKLARDISWNLQAIVLDEADRLLQTEAVARHLQSRRQQSQSSSSSSKKKPGRNLRLSETPTENLLESLLLQPRKKQLQIICASATVGRTLRKQLMQILQAPSMDKAATLITADVRTKKDAAARKATLLPSTLEHSYLLLPDISKSEDTQQVILDVLWKTLQEKLNPAPTLIFPGRVGVDRVQEELRGKGLQCIRGLSNTMETHPKSSDGSYEWQTTPIYVVGEKLGRGIDLEGIRYVILLQVPSSAAGYTHLAGRTGRNGEKGTAIAFCQPREAPKLLTIAETLGLSFSDLASSLPPGEETIYCGPEHAPATDAHDINDKSSQLQWMSISDSSLKRKTIAEITEYLTSHGVPVYSENKKRATKAGLLSAVHELHRSTE